MNIKQQLKKVLGKLSYVQQLQKEIAALKKNSLYPAGHFYSPVVSVDAITEREHEIWDNTGDEIAGIDLNTQTQIDLIKELSVYYNELPFKDNRQPGIRYYFDNEFYSYTDAVVLYAMIRHFKPKQIVEIGSGFSSAVMLDTNALFFGNTIKLTFIEPYPERLNALLFDTDKDHVTIVEEEVQSTSTALFSRLEKGDILFIDSSHVVKTGSDVHHILFNIFPVIQPGVIIHFHDVFFPFEYPKQWVLKGFNWNEDYFLRAFMMHNTSFEILLFSEYLHRLHGDVFNKMPLCYKNPGGNFWITRVK